ncbi:MAG TPA: class I tRNA ligase family protein, partial [Actinomycetota bacterium]|nr:class I tRNA ligase family protein [Actinomycetota bacterium]
PAMLMALDLPIARTVFAHGFLQVGGEKMSKSRLTGISPYDLVSTFGADGYRYYFMRDISFGLDGNFSWEAMVARYNSDLANDFGNLASRVLSMVGRYLEGIVPAPPSDAELERAEEELRSVYEKAFGDMKRAIDEIAPDDALKAAWSFVRKANAYVEEVAPWKLAKDEAQRRRLEVVLYSLLDALRLLALMTSCAIPEAAQELWTRLGAEGEVASKLFTDEGGWGRLSEGRKTTTGDPLFPRLEDDAAKA